MSPRLGCEEPSYCGQVCHCGDDVDSHHMGSGHGAVPMYCSVCDPDPEPDPEEVAKSKPYAACLYDELGTPLWNHLEITGPGWYEVRSGHWELLLWMNESSTNQWPNGTGWLEHIDTVEGSESDLKSVWGEAPVRYRLPTVWDHLLRVE